MAWIRTVPESEATGIVKEEYEAGIERTGRVYNIVKAVQHQAGKPQGVHQSV